MLKLKIKLQSKNIIYFELFWICVMLFFESVFNFPGFIKYFTDLFLIYAMVKCIGKFKINIVSSKSLSLCIVMCLILITASFGALFNGVSPMLFIWALRNNMRFYIFVICCIVLLGEIDIDNIFKMFKVLFWINLPIMVFQYVFQGVDGDNAGGIFGNMSGCNAYTNIFLCVMISYILGRLIAKKTNIFIFLLYSAVCFYIAAIAELKMFFVEYIIILAVAFISYKFSFKNILFVVLGVAIIYIGFELLSRYFPDAAKMMGDSDAIERYLEGNGYTNSGDINRLNAFEIIRKKFFGDNVFRNMFGFGMGSCEHSQFSFFNSEFYNRYGWLNYRLFSHSWLYLEQGYVGVVLCVLFFITIMVWLLRHRSDIVRKDLWITSFVFVPTCVIGLMYNCAIQIEICYMIAFMCAIPFVVYKSNRKDDLSKNSLELGNE